MYTVLLTGTTGESGRRVLHAIRWTGESGRRVFHAIRWTGESGRCVFVTVLLSGVVVWYAC